MASGGSPGFDAGFTRSRKRSQSSTWILGAAFWRDPLKIVDDRFEPRVSDKFRGLRGLRGMAPQGSGVHSRTPASPPRSKKLRGRL